MKSVMLKSLYKHMFTVDKNLKKQFNPEFINRLDDIVIFNK